MTTAIKNCKLLYFAWVREKMGRPGEDIEIPPTVVTVADLLNWLKSKGGEYAHALKNEQVIRVALDQVHATPETKLGHTREIALFPPVTGG